MTINDDIKQACEVMQRGGIILYPTDTIWGIGCDATNAEAVQRVYKIKQRADSKALIVLTDSEAKVEYYVSEVPETAWKLLDVAVKPGRIPNSSIAFNAPTWAKPLAPPPLNVKPTR